MNQLNPHQWVAAHADYLYGFAIVRVNDEEQAKDLVQETFLAALQRVPGFEGKSSERTWLTAILKNKIVDIYRKKSSGLKAVEAREADEREQDDFFDPDNGHWVEKYGPKEVGELDKDNLVSKEFELILKKCLQKLPALWMSVFVMKHIDEEPSEAICTELKISPSNFWVTIHRAKVNLRACLQRNWI